MTSDLRAPFPYFGGKSKIAGMVWERFGQVQNYVEPFFGSGAVLLGCPWPGHTETVNDVDALLANFWRAPAAVADTLAPILPWRVCHVWDWLTFLEPDVLPTTRLVAEVYGGSEAQELNARTGCIGCPLAEQDTALDYVISLPQWSYLAPLKRLKPLYRELREFRHRKQKDGERNKDGNFSSHPSRKGPLTLAAREWALGVVLGIQAEINAAAEQIERPPIDLINAEEEARIRELIAARTYPQKWSDDDPDAIELIPQTYSDGTRQELLLTTLA